MQKLRFIGNLASDPVMKTVNVKDVPTKVTNFSVAVNERGREGATFFSCHAWRGQAETCAEFLKKGRKVYIEGPVHMNSYKDSSGAIRYNMEVRVDEIEFLDKKPINAAEAEEAEEALEQLPEDFPCA